MQTPLKCSHCASALARHEGYTKGSVRGQAWIELLFLGVHIKQIGCIKGP